MKEGLPMGNNNWIRRITLGSSVLSVGLHYTNRVVIRVTADTRFFYEESEADANYFTLKAGSIVVLDPPQYIDVLWFRLDDITSTGNIEIWATGGE